ncbi:hypothetical protein LINGRAHAP2_LOCUS7937 [Linum grandiflorum]
MGWYGRSKTHTIPDSRHVDKHTQPPTKIQNRGQCESGGKSVLPLHQMPQSRLRKGQMEKIYTILC